jgi:hypothetical protein
MPKASIHENRHPLPGEDDIRARAAAGCSNIDWSVDPVSEPATMELSA